MNKKGVCIFPKFALYGSKPFLGIQETPSKSSPKAETYRPCGATFIFVGRWNQQKHSALGLTARVLPYDGETWFVGGLLQ